MTFTHVKVHPLSQDCTMLALGRYNGRFRTFLIRYEIAAARFIVRQRHVRPGELVLRDFSSLSRVEGDRQLGNQRGA
jgi:hypothetical protein